MERHKGHANDMQLRQLWNWHSSLGWKCPQFIWWWRGSVALCLLHSKTESQWSQGLVTVPDSCHWRNNVAEFVRACPWSLLEICWVGFVDTVAIVECLVLIMIGRDYVGPLCRRIQWGRTVSASYRRREPHQLPEWNWHQWRWWHPGRRQPWQQVSHCCVPAWHSTHWRVWMSVREGEPLLWPENNVGGIRCDIGQEQSACSCAEYSLHCLILYTENALSFCWS